MHPSRLWLPLVMLAGCAWEPGEGFAVLEPTVHAAYSPEPSRDAGDGYQRLASDYQVRLSAATLRLERIELIARVGGDAGRFDPSNPPPGYSLCHNGHCHRDDGALIPYEDIEAELAGGGAQTIPVATLPVGAMDLFASETRAVSCEPGCELPRTVVSRGRWAVTALRLDGTVRDGRTPPRFPGERPFRLELTAAPMAEPVAVLAGDLDVASDRAHAPRILLALRLDVTPRIFDEVDWAAATPEEDGTLDLGATHNTAARTSIIQHLAELNPTAEVQREDW